MRTVLAPEQAPVLFHCTAGKDRTGWAATVLLLAAGVDEDGRDRGVPGGRTRRSRQTFAPLLTRFSDAGGDPELLRPVLEVRAEYLGAALASVHERFGSFDGYLAGGLGLSPTEVEALRKALRPGG